MASEGRRWSWLLRCFSRWDLLLLLLLGEEPERRRVVSFGHWSVKRSRSTSPHIVSPYVYVVLDVD